MYYGHSHIYINTIDILKRGIRFERAGKASSRRGVSWSLEYEDDLSKFEVQENTVKR